MKTCTVADVMSWRPCQPDDDSPGYLRERVTELRG